VALNGWFQEKFMLNHLGAAKVNMSTDTFNVGLIASGTLAARSVTEGYEFVSDLLNNNGSALTEVATTGGTNYSRQSLVSVSWSLSGLVIKFTANNPDWSTGDFTTVYGWIHDETASSGTDATRPLLGIFDFGGAQNPTAGFILNVNSSGIWNNTDSQ
jgi:hypothetical protein